VDNNPESYSVEILVGWKTGHEISIVELGINRGSYEHVLEPPPAARLFFERVDDTLQLKENLERYFRVALLGISGSGKTQLARRWFAECRSQYTFAWWLRGDSREVLEGDIAALAPLVGLGRERIDTTQQASAVRAKLEQSSGWLIVVDNAVSPDELFDLLPGGDGHLILTSQDQSWVGVVDGLTIPPWSDADAMAMLRKSPALKSASDWHLIELVHLCAGLPLTVDQAASYIAKTNLPLDSYLTLLKSRRVDTIKAMTGGRGGLIEAIEVAIETAGSDAREVLAMLATVAPGPFLLTAMPSVDDGADDVWDLMRLQTALGELRSFSLAHREGDVVVAHELVLDVVRASLDDLQRYVAFARALMTVAQKIPERPRESYEWPAFEQVLPHVLTLIDVSKQGVPPGTRTALVHIINRTAQYFGGRGDVERAVAMFARAVELSEHLRGDDLATLGSVVHNFANVIADTGKFSEAENLHRIALDLKRRALGHEDLVVGVSHGALGEVLQNQGNWPEAISNYEQALAIYRLVGDKAWIANGLIDVAGVAVHEDRLGSAHSLLLEAIAESDSVDSLPESVTARLRLADLYRFQGDLPKAASLARQARVMSKQRGALAQFAEATLTQAAVLAQLERYDSADALVAQAVSVPSEVFATGKVSVAKQLGNFGFGIAMGGRPDLGVPRLIDSQETLESLLPADQEDIAVARLMTAKAMAMRMDLAGAAGRLRQLLADARAGSEAAAEAAELLEEWGQNE
jgi:tetratricopeptide (TPR) repeat protein